MRYLKMMVAAIALMLITACSGSSSYSPEKCQQLAEKIDNNDQLTSDDYNEMIDQFVAVVKVINDKKNEIGEDPAKTREYAMSEEGRQQLGYAIGFAFYLQAHEADLTEDNIKKLNEANAELEKLKD